MKWEGDGRMSEEDMRKITHDRASSSACSFPAWPTCATIHDKFKLRRFWLRLLSEEMVSLTSLEVTMVLCKARRVAYETVFFLQICLLVEGDAGVLGQPFGWQRPLPGIPW